MRSWAIARAYAALIVMVRARFVGVQVLVDEATFAQMVRQGILVQQGCRNLMN